MVHKHPHAAGVERLPHKQPKARDRRDESQGQWTGCLRNTTTFYFTRARWCQGQMVGFHL